MAFTRVWADNGLLGSAAANTIDDRVNDFRVDVRQRLASAFTDIDADPMVLKLASLPAIAQITPGLNTLIHWSEGCAGDDTFGDNQQYVTTASRSEVAPTGTGSLDWIMPVMVPIGGVISIVHARVRRTAGATITVTLNRVNQTSGSVSALGTNTSASTGYHDLPISALAHTVEDGYYYFIVLAMSQPAGAAFFMGIQLG